MSAGKLRLLVLPKAEEDISEIAAFIADDNLDVHEHEVLVIRVLHGARDIDNLS